MAGFVMTWTKCLVLVVILGSSAGCVDCECGRGWRGIVTNSTNCTNINECTEERHNCHDKATCTDSQGSFACACLLGYDGDGTSCININECSTGVHDCSIGAQCSDSDGSFTCHCKQGFNGDGLNCTDVDECSNPSMNNCHMLARCKDTVGSFTCDCKSSYAGDGVQECFFDPAPGSAIAVVRVVFAAVLPFERISLFTNASFLVSYRHAVALASNSDVSLVHVTSIDTPAQRKLLTDSSEVWTQMVMPEQQFHDVQGNFISRLEGLLQERGTPVLSVLKPDAQDDSNLNSLANQPDAKECNIEIVIGAGTGSVAGFGMLLLCIFCALKERWKHLGHEDKDDEDLEAGRAIHPVPEPSKNVAKAELGYANFQKVPSDAERVGKKPSESDDSGPAKVIDLMEGIENFAFNSLLEPSDPEGRVKDVLGEGGREELIMAGLEMDHKPANKPEAGRHGLADYRFEPRRAPSGRENGYHGGREHDVKRAPSVVKNGGRDGHTQDESNGRGKGGRRKSYYEEGGDRNGREDLVGREHEGRDANRGGRAHGRTGRRKSVDGGDREGERRGRDPSKEPEGEGCREEERHGGRAGGERSRERGEREGGRDARRAGGERAGEAREEHEMNGARERRMRGRRHSEVAGYDGRGGGLREKRERSREPGRQAMSMGAGGRL